MPANNVAPPSPKKQLKQAVAKAMKESKTEIPTTSYYELVKDSLRLKALLRGGVREWDGFDACFDEQYDDACISELPRDMLD